MSVVVQKFFQVKRMSVRMALNGGVRSGTPYNITTGRDDNGDTVFNDRPAGVRRNSARGASQWNLNLRVSRTVNLGGVLGIDGPMMLGGPPPPTIVGGVEVGPGSEERRGGEGS